MGFRVSVQWFGMMKKLYADDVEATRGHGDLMGAALGGLAG